MCKNKLKCFEWWALLLPKDGPCSQADIQEAACEIIELPGYVQLVVFEWLALAKAQIWPNWSKSQAETLEEMIWGSGGPAGSGGTLPTRSDSLIG